MIIHLTVPRKYIMEEIETMRAIIEVIHRKGQVMARDWIEPYYNTAKQNKQDLPPGDIFKLNMEAIARADMLIVEATTSSFSVGYQVASAVSKRKPVLILVAKGKTSDEGSFSRGIDDPFVVRQEYTPNTLTDVINEFIDQNTISTKDLRFNFVIDRQLYNHIRWKSFKSRKTKAEIVRELLISDMENDRS